jgi:phosphatidylinositol glycan class Z
MACRPSAMAVQSTKLDKTADANLPSSQHGQFLLVYSLLVMIRLHFALSNSYIHPDEHFQGPEVVVGDLLGWQASLPWEFTNDNPVNSPIRSILPIWLVYGLPIRVIKMFYGVNPDPMLLFRAVRLTFFCLSFLNDWAVSRLARETHRRSAVLLYASSYVTWTFQTHTFSNSIEAILVSCSLVTILTFKHTQANVSWAAFSLGILCSLGVFFRITFPAFLFPAMVSCIPELLRRPQKLVLPGLSFLLGAFVSIAADTYYFSSHPSLSHPVITPWSNFK